MGFAKELKNPLVLEIERIASLREVGGCVHASHFKHIRSQRLVEDVMRRLGFYPDYRGTALSGFKRSSSTGAYHGGKTGKQLVEEALLTYGEITPKMVPVAPQVISHYISQMRKNGWVIEACRKGWGELRYVAIIKPQKKPVAEAATG